MVVELGNSKLFEPLVIGNGTLTLSHRIVHAPLTRCRGVPLNENPTTAWTPDELVAKYYAERATPGGLIISEGIPPSLEGGSTPAVPGLYLPEQLPGWKKVVDAVHNKGGFIYAQLWHAGRTAKNLRGFTGEAPLGPSAIPLSTDEVPPREMSKEDITRTIEEFVRAAKRAMSVGFDGIEVHGGNGYIVDQFLNDNINVRTDEYGGSPENMCRFPLELLEALVTSIGQEKIAIRLTPFGLFNETRGSRRIEIWSYFCKEIKRQWSLSYIHFIEPRYEQIIPVDEKDAYLKSNGLQGITLEPFRKIMGDTPFFSAGGWNEKNSLGPIESGRYDALVYGRYFLANPDFVERMRLELPLNKYRREFFYGPFEVREEGYTDYPTWAEAKKQYSKKVIEAA